MARTHGLYSSVRITFVAAGHPHLTDTLPTSFIRTAKRTKPKTSQKTKQGRKR